VSDNGTVTPDGDIVIHNKGTFTYTASFQNEDGSDRNMTGRNLYFVTNSGIRVQLLPGVNAWEKKLVIPQETLKVALRMTSEFAIVDEKPMPSMLWNGRAVSRSGVVMAGTVIISGSPSGSVVIKGGAQGSGSGGTGLSAYQLALLEGFEGTEEAWLASLRGSQARTARQVRMARQVRTDQRVPLGGDPLVQQEGMASTAQQTSRASWT
jgi:hypothetical protein